VLHPLTIDDAQKFDQRPTIEEYPGYVFMVVYGIDEILPDGPDLCEVHVIISGRWVVTIHRQPIVALASVRERFRDRPPRSPLLRVYRILDAVTATFLPMLALIDDEIDDIEDEVIGSQTTASLRRISALKRDVIEMRRVVTPMRDVFGHGAGSVLDLPGLIATIFLPLTFITGFFGMNFGYLTNELIDTRLSFVVFGVLLLIAATLAFIIYFRRRGWIGHHRGETAVPTRAPLGDRRNGVRASRG